MPKLDKTIAMLDKALAKAAHKPLAAVGVSQWRITVERAATGKYIATAQRGRESVVAGGKTRQLAEEAVVNRLRAGGYAL